MTPRVLVLDTSYLSEVYQVPPHFERAAHREVTKRIAAEVERDSRFYVPVPAILELANHVTHVKNGNDRVRLASKVAAEIKSSIEHQAPWIIVPGRDEILPATAALLAAVDDFRDAFAAQSIGLTDVAVIHEARRLKERYRDRKWSVHIWTRDQKLKAQEPDKEHDAFV